MKVGGWQISSKTVNNNLCFFFQAEDGIRDTSVTGVQTVLFRSPALDQGQRPLLHPQRLPTLIKSWSLARSKFSLSKPSKAVSLPTSSKR